MELIFQSSSLLAMPFWLLMIALPRWRWSQRIVASPLIALPAALLYVMLFLPQVGALVPALLNPTLQVVAALLGTPEGATIAWVHFLAFDLLVGRWIYLDAQARGITAWGISPILFFVLMAGPLGFAMTKWMRWIVAGVSALLLAGLLVVGGAGMFDAQASRSALRTYSPRGDFVDVNGARMHVICRGEGEPTLVLQAGIAGGALDWLPLMDELDDTFRICAFDRLGQDWSDAAPMPRTFGTAADELHLALTGLGIANPILVGHSLGGAVVQIYAGRYETAGVVLVEGLSLDATPAVTERLGIYQSLDWAADLGLLRPLGSLMADRAYPDNLRNEMIALRSRPEALRNTSAEGAVAAQSATADLRHAEPDMTAPLLVIAAGKSEIPEHDLFLTALQALADRHDLATFELVPDAGHYLIASHAELAADLIEAWVKERSLTSPNRR